MSDVPIKSDDCTFIALNVAVVRDILEKLEKASLLSSDEVQSLVQSAHEELRKHYGTP